MSSWIPSIIWTMLYLKMCDSISPLIRILKSFVLKSILLELIKMMHLTYENHFELLNIFHLKKCWHMRKIVWNTLRIQSSLLTESSFLYWITLDIYSHCSSLYTRTCNVAPYTIYSFLSFLQFIWLMQRKCYKYLDVLLVYDVLCACFSNCF